MDNIYKEAEALEELTEWLETAPMEKIKAHQKDIAGMLSEMNKIILSTKKCREVFQKRLAEDENVK